MATKRGLFGQIVAHDLEDGKFGRVVGSNPVAVVGPTAGLENQVANFYGSADDRRAGR